MPYAYVNSSSAVTATATASVTYTPASAGNLLVFVGCITYGTGCTVTTFGDGSTTSDTYTQDHIASASGWAGSLFIGHVANCSATARTASILFNGGGNCGLAVFEYSGIATASPYQGWGAQTAGGTGGTGVATSSITVGTAPALLVGLSFDFNIPTTAQTVGTTPLSFTGRTAAFNGFNSATLALGIPEDVRLTTTGSYAANWLTPGATNYDQIVSIAAAFTEGGAPTNVASIAWTV